MSGDFERSHEVTFHGAVNAVRAALPELERSAGTIVAVVSIWEPSGDGEATETVPGRRSVWNTIRLAAGIPVDVLQAVPGVRGIVRCL